MGDTEHPLDPREALADIQTSARVALRSDDLNAVRRDLEMILTIAKMVRPPSTQPRDSREGYFS
jgi:hypothetical protein